MFCSEDVLGDAISRARLSAGIRIDALVAELGVDGPQRRAKLESGLEILATLLGALRLEQDAFAGFKHEIEDIKSSDIEYGPKYPDRTSKEILKGFLDEVVSIVESSLGGPVRGGAAHYR